MAFKYTGWSYNEDIPQENLRWRILRKYDDGSMDIISDATTKKIGLNLSQGYNNGVFLLNDIAKTLYSKPSKGIYARSLNLEDDEYWLNTTPENHKMQMSISEEIIMNKNVGDKIDIIDYMQLQNNKNLIKLQKFNQVCNLIKKWRKISIDMHYKMTPDEKRKLKKIFKESNSNKRP